MQFWPALMWTMAWLPASVIVRVAGLALGFGLVAALKRTRLRRPAIAVGEAVNVGSLVLAAGLPVVVALAGLGLAIYLLVTENPMASATAVLIGAIATAVITPFYLFIMVFTADQSPRDVA
ncbi:hypothetical protein [Pseudonocardia sp. TRM90224]|uniref:hypothetical protein n=1 Tax=Pseudonocardia sp. TRM90224 TaxID=2812678 RepID=UPI001E5D95C9|nr:hypothetical protein [Pseudonocardia sp. TRM90224]